uniref:ImmA/IrrE family metallo-endopeptidase n=1 Tax=Ningiella ruwaisensis TaxID=2364274 RepID=UPI00109F08C4|nr:ImmA/IrrE family metallo-endopeptidase [Ningiella ruwaisensis]
MTEFNLPSKSTIYRQIKDIGVSKATIKRILPVWWNDELLQSNSGFLQFVNLMSQRLGVSVSLDKGYVSFSPSNYSVQYKKRSHIDASQLSDATYLCHAIANTLIGALQYNDRSPELSRLCASLRSLEDLTLGSALPVFWDSNIPVIHVSHFPSNVARPAGMVMRNDNYYAIVLGHKHKSPSTQLFVLLHELGHIVSGHLKGDGSITDSLLPELGESLDVETDTQEEEADAFALNILRKNVDISEKVSKLGRLSRPAELAIHAKRASSLLGVNAGHFALTYGRHTRDWILAQQALKFLEKGNAISTLRGSLDNALSSMDMRMDDREFLTTMQSGK